MTSKPAELKDKRPSGGPGTPNVRPVTKTRCSTIISSRRPIQDSRRRERGTSIFHTLFMHCGRHVDVQLLARGSPGTVKVPPWLASGDPPARGSPGSAAAGLPPFSEDFGAPAPNVLLVLCGGFVSTCPSHHRTALLTQRDFV